MLTCVLSDAQEDRALQALAMAGYKHHVPASKLVLLACTMCPILPARPWRSVAGKLQNTMKSKGRALAYHNLRHSRETGPDVHFEKPVCLLSEFDDDAWELWLEKCELAL